MTDELRSELRVLLARQTFRKNPTRLADGREVAYYTDSRLVTLTPRGVWLTAHLLAQVIAPYHPHCIGGPTIAAVPIIGALAYMSEIIKKSEQRFFFVRPAAKNYGRGKLIEGHLEPSTRAVLVDDVIATGASLLHAANAILNEGVIPVAAVTLIDRQWGAKELFAQHNIPLHSLFTLQEIIDTQA